MSESFKEIINKEFLQNVLNENETYKVTIVDYTSKYALGKGENYLSLVFRVCLKLSDDSQRHWIIKTLPDNKKMIEFLEESRIFVKEIELYDIWFPKMIDLYEKRRKTDNGSKIMPNWPKSYKSSKKVLILDDLAPEGFKMFPRHKLFDLEHSLLAIRALAEFHIYSMLLLEEHPNMEEIMPEVFFDDERTFEAYSLKFIQKFKSALETWTGYERFIPIVEKIVPKCFDLQTLILKKGKYKCFAHSDCWINNFLFKYNENHQPCDIRLLDFQVVRVGTPIIDLHFLINTSIRYEIWIANEELIINTYYKHIEKLCDEINKKIPFSLEELWIEYEKTWFWGFCTATTFLPLVLADPLKDDDDEIEHDFEKGERFAKECQKKLIYFEEKGYLNQIDKLLEEIENNK